MPRRPTATPYLTAVPSTQPSPLDAGLTLAAIEALYAFAEEPAKWEDVIEALEALPTSLDPATDAAAATISTHAQRASELATRLNEARRHRLQAPEPWDAILVSAEGRARAFLGTATELLQDFFQEPPQLGLPLNLKAQARNAWNAAFQSVGKDANRPLTPVTFMDPDSATRAFGLLIAREAFPEGLVQAFNLGADWSEPLFAIVFLSHQEHRPLYELAQSALGLTAAEARLAAKLAVGRQIADASEELNISPHTARTQLKAIFAKTGARRQSELIGILGKIAAFGHHPNAQETGAKQRNPSRRFITLEDGRKLFYREYGSPNGAPVLYFHVGLAGSLILTKLVDAAKGRLRLIAFERPGFGQSTSTNDYGFACVTRDVSELITQLKLKHVSLLGDGTGGAFAMHAALELGPIVKKLGLRAPRLFRPQRGEAGSFQSALSAMIRQPWLIRSVVDILRRGAQVPLLRAMADRWVSPSPGDLARVANDEAIVAFQMQMVDALEVSSAGFASEMTLFQNPPRWDVARLRCPVAMWVGAENGVLNVKETSALIAESKDAKIRILPDVGIEFSRAVWDEIATWLK